VLDVDDEFLVQFEEPAQEAGNELQILLAVWEVQRAIPQCTAGCHRLESPQTGWSAGPWAGAAAHCRRALAVERLAGSGSRYGPRWAALAARSCIQFRKPAGSSGACSAAASNCGSLSNARDTSALVMPCGGRLMTSMRSPAPMSPSASHGPPGSRRTRRHQAGRRAAPPTTACPRSRTRRQPCPARRALSDRLGRHRAGSRLAAARVRRLGASRSPSRSCRR